MDLKSAQIDQWKEYSICHINRCGSERELADRLRELDAYLLERVYFAGNNCSEADIALYQSLHLVLMNLGFSEKENYRNLSRWFDNIQHKCGQMTGKLSTVVFLKSPIYLPAFV